MVANYESYLTINNKDKILENKIKEYHYYTMSELRSIAKQNKIRYYSSLKKEDLIEEIKKLEPS